MTTKLKSLLIIIIFTLILILPVGYALVKNYFFTPKSDVIPAVPQQGVK